MQVDKQDEIKRYELMARTRVFDIDRAIETATEIFWRNGYERTSLATLTGAMGITPPSFYYAFGSKDGLFKKVLAHYLKTRLGYAEEALNQPTAFGVAEQMLYRLADLYTEPGYPPGCLAMNCTLPCADDADPLGYELTDLRDARRMRLQQRFRQAWACGDLPKAVEPDELARFVLTVGWGMAHDARSGATRENLYRTVVWSLKGWPGR
jgi:AcrR family transcriptional regulator